MYKVFMGCIAGVGQGGLGGHLNFVYQSVKHGGGAAHVFTSSPSSSSSDGINKIPSPTWNKFVKYTPMRWMPATKVYWESVYFDREVSIQLAKMPIVYHSFPGYAENSFRKVRGAGGITVLEAATTHVSELYSDTNEEHRKYKMKGSPFHKLWVERVMREYELADYITVASQLQKDSFIRQGIRPDKLLFSPLGVNTERFQPVPEQSSLIPRAKGEKFRIISVGQVSLLKGFQYLLEAVKMTEDREIEVTLYGGIGWRSIRNLILDYMKSGIDIKLGVGDPVPALRNSHLCVHSSINDGFGLAPLEAMATGVPTIVTDSTGMKDAICHGVNGIIVSPRDAKGLAESIVKLKNDDNDRIRIAKAARLATTNYDFRKCVAQYSEVLSPIWKSNGVSLAN
ncbi:D-inositol-3-phosphate glycosyltransferase [Paenibacillus solanacearum]|uniref:D-inositol-3-phosphate glycosyltransferase n=1 Tax=Paenibacillus solanacearum TaxID=2048548 RepID=A0A916K0S9_9BACL|nr:glycosyltransferase family 4 protein [Paenibacillus solanacearum]CAG7613144.1 D-inositol-3-phosphate glycosyltransferase [Paenibacillus solanacearum]